MSTIFKIDDLLIDLKDATPGGVAFTEKTEIPTLSVVQRLAVLRRVQLLIDKPLDLHVLRTYRTVGELWSWMSDTLNGDAPGTPRLFVSNSATTRIRLRPIQESDLMSLYMSAMDPGEGIRWRFRGATIPPDQFVATLYDGVRCQYAVEDQTSRDLVGLVVAYDHRDIAGHCKIGFYRVANSNVPNAWGPPLRALCV